MFFLDCDGVINCWLLGDYVKFLVEFFLNDGVENVIVLVNWVFGCVVVVINQQGIGKGLMIECNFFEVYDYCDMLLEKYGVRIDVWYFVL